MLPENIRKSVSNNESLTLNIISTSMFPSFFIVAGVWVMYGISIFVMNRILRKRKLKLISLRKKHAFNYSYVIVMVFFMVWLLMMYMAIVMMLM